MNTTASSETTAKAAVKRCGPQPTTGCEHAGGQEGDGKACREEMLAPADNEVRPRAHRRKIGADVDRVGDEQEEDKSGGNGPRKDRQNVGRQTLAGHAGDGAA